MRVLRFDLRYDGTDFKGWQIQPGLRTVQGEVTRVLAGILDEPITLIGAGRTDAGVHATGQVATLNTRRTIEPTKLRHALAGLLPRDIGIDRVALMPTGFHARFSAHRRIYHYHLCRKPGPIRRRYAWIVPDAPPAATLNRLFEPLLGRHSFRPFTQGEGRSGETTCHLDRAAWRESGDRLILVIAADRFLYRMVRLLVGAAIAAGRHDRHDAGALGRILLAEGPLPRLVPAPPEGLFLAGIEYPERWVPLAFCDRTSGLE